MNRTIGSQRSTNGPTPARVPAHDPISAAALGRVAGIIMIVSAGIGLPATSLLVPPGHRGVSQILAVAAMLVGVFCWFAPWDRWPRGATVVIPIFSLLFMSGGIYQAKRADTFAAFFVVIFAWTGFAHARWTCIRIAPLAIAVYALPVALRGGGLAEAGLAFYYVPVAVITGEALAWLSGRLRSSESELRQLSQLKDEFTAMVAHDMRTPIVIISGFADTLRNRVIALDETERGYVDTIARNAKRASHFVENLLQFARFEVDEFTQVVRAFDFADLAGRVIIDLGGEDPARVTLTLADDLPHALGDEDRNAQVLTNLLSNAMKYSSGKIDVEVTRAEGMLRVAVRDRGTGVPGAEMPKLFQKFAAIDLGDDAQHAAGTGLGLYICRRIVEAQGGRIWAERPAEGGTRFVYTVPIADASDLVHLLDKTA